MGPHRPSRWGVLLVVSLAVIILVIDATTIEVSLRALVVDLDTSLSALQSIITVFTLVKAAFILTGAKLQDLIGRKRTFFTGAAVYGAGACVAAVSHNAFLFCIGWSVLEGIGTVLMLPATTTFITGTYEGKDRAFAFGFWGGIASAASIVGLVVGGYLATFYSWRWIFVVEVVILVLIAALHGVLEETRPTSSWRQFDYGGLILSASGLTCLVSGILLMKEPDHWGEVPFLVAGGVVLLVALYFWERRQQAEDRAVLVDVTILPDRTFLAGNVVAVGQKFIAAGFLFIFPLFYEVVTGASAYETGIAILPMSVAIVAFSVLGTRLASWCEPKYVLLAGIAVVGAGLAALRDVFSLSTTVHDTLFGSVLFGVGLGIVLSQVTNLTLSSIGNERQTDASGIYNTTRQIGSSLGTGIIGVVLSIGYALGLRMSDPSSFRPDPALGSLMLSDMAVNQAMEWAFLAMIAVVVMMFIAGMCVRKTGRIE